jgi:hypothetical protein
MWVAIFGKTGYSGWLGVLMIVPVVNVVAFFVLAAREWPIQREVRDLRIRCGSGTEEDAYSLIREGSRLEAKGKSHEALRRYQEVVARFKDTAAGKDAAKGIEALQAKLGEM